MDIETFINYKNNAKCLIITNEINILINTLGGKKIHKNNNNNQILKNPKMQSLKDKVDNKVNLILNKLSEMNFNNLIQDFIELVGKINETDYIELQKAFYIKMQSDINFVKIYVEFFKIISKIYSDLYKLQPEYFFKILEIKFINDYSDITIDFDEQQYIHFNFLSNYDEENKRINNLNIIKTLITASMIKSEIKEEINNVILGQNVYYADIYYWFYNETLTEEQKKIIKSKTVNNTLSLREKVLLDNLLSLTNEKTTTKEDKNVTKSTVKNKVSVKNTIDTLELEINNLLEEYFYEDNCDDIKKFINVQCKDALLKNKFCYYIYTKYFDVSSEKSQKILELIQHLLKNQTLFKSNLSRGILMMYVNWDEISLDCSNPTKKIKELLLLLKNNGITKNLENLLKTYEIDYE